MTDELIQKAHSKFQEYLSIEVDVIRFDDNRYSVRGRVVTYQGSFSAIVHGHNMGPTALDKLEEDAIYKALKRAGLELEPLAPPIKIGKTASAVAEPSVFQTREISESSAETAQIMCSNDQDGANPHPITAYYAGSDIMSVEDVARRTAEKHGAPMCADCSSAEVRKRTKRAAK